MGPPGSDRCQAKGACARRQKFRSFPQHSGVCKKSTTRRLTLRRGKSYNDSTEEMVLTALSTPRRLPMQSACGSRFPSRVPEQLVGCFGLLGPLVLRSLTSLMKERETQAAASWRLVERRANETLKRSRFEKPKLRSLPAKVGVGHVWLLVNLRSDQIRWQHRIGAQCFKLESLILAQNERWRQA